ncbi:MAG: efflux RND transporter permease subunit [Spirochaetales bacterium]|nr:efflux RND transporter permease subunit [Spirochaetales bacterium]
MSIAEFSIEKKTIVYLLSFLLLVGGYIGFNRVGRLEDPDFTINVVKIITMYPGAEPREVEEEVSDIIEQYVQKIPELKYVESESSYGQSIVTVTYKDGFNGEEYRQLYDELRKRMTDVQLFLPSGVYPPFVYDDFKDVYGILYAITGDGYNMSELYDFTEYIQKQLLLIEGVSKVELMSEPTEVVYLEMSRSKLVNMGISEDEIYGLIQYQNQIVDSGTVQMGGERLQFQVSGTLETVQSLGDIVIASAGDRNVYLSDIANIYMGYQNPPSGVFRYNGQDAIGLGISVITTENVVEVGDRINARLKELESETPIGLEMQNIFNQPDAVTRAVDNFLISLVQAVVIVIALLMIFMGIQSGIIIGGILVLIIAGTLFLMNLFDITLQRISLGALIIAMGMLVDNSIVITEGILVRYQRGEDRMKAASEVVKRNIWSLFGATLVAIIAFASVGMSPDAAGEYTKTLFYVIIISLMLSWILAITLNPLVCYQFLRVKPVTTRDAQLGGRVMGGYKRFLHGCLSYKWISLMVVIAILALSLGGFRYVESAFFPNSTQPQFLIDYWMPEGTDISETEKGMKEIEEILLEEEHITKVSTFVGEAPLRFQLTFSPEATNSKYGMFLIEVDDNKILDEIIPRLQTELSEKFFEPTIQVIPFAIGPGGKGTVATRVYGPDPDVIREISEEIKTIYKSTENAVAIRDSWGERIKTMDIEIDEFQARRVGITRPQINQALKQGFDGRTVGVFRSGNKQMPIISIPPDNERNDIAYVQDLYVHSSVTGSSVPLSQLIKNINFIWKDKVINRRDRTRMMTVQCDPLEGQPSVLFAQVKPAINALELPPGYYIEHGGEYESSRDAQAMIMGNLPIAILAMFLTIVLLWNSFRQPIIVFLSIPLSIIGVTAGLLITGTPFSFMAIMGLLSLFGMVIKNAIVLVDEFDLKMEGDGDPFEGIVEASVSRVRPVMMAAFSTILGMIPLISDSFFQGMAVTIMFGLAVASIITLVITPVLYAIFFGIDPAPKQKIIEEK